MSETCPRCNGTGVVEPFSGRTHGIPATYTAGCACDECREAWRVYAQRRRAGRGVKK